MNTPLKLTPQPKQVPTNHIAPDFYIDSNRCTLQNAVQRLAIDREVDIPFII
jgi:hypothetical protein